MHPECGCCAVWSRGGLGLGLFGLVCVFEFFRAEEGALAHGFARFEFDGCSCGNDDVFFGFIGVSADAGFGEADFKDSEVSEFDVLAVGEGVGDIVESFLDYGEDILLDDAGFVADAHYEVAFGKVWHEEKKEELICRRGVEAKGNFEYCNN